MARHHTVSKKAFWAGWVLTILPVAGLLMSAVMKFMKPPEVVEGFTKLGVPESLAFNLGILELACTIIYLIPRTAVLGAVLLTGYLGGAVATHVRIHDAFMSPIIIGVLLWGGIFLREPRLRALIPLRQSNSPGKVPLDGAKSAAEAAK